jgi:DNA-binding MarR family transcriptional regulator/N-acetylglutamate synthase-like GNAT family acetyltransferase
MKYLTLASMVDVNASQTKEFRAFNRFYTSIMGFLDRGLLHSDFTLTEARVIFELAQQDVIDAANLRARMKIDPGHISRILGRLESSDLVERSRSESDGRRQVVRLTQRGREAFQTLDARSDQQAEQLLADLAPAERAALMSSLATARALLDLDTDRTHTVVIRDLRAGDLGWVVHRHGALYAAEYGWDQSFEALVAGIVAEFRAGVDATRERAWIAELDGRPAGCVFCVRKDKRTAQLRLLLVEPTARGFGIGTQLVSACLAFATSCGYQSIVLWTNDVLHAARQIYQRAGFELVEEESHHSFGHDLVGQFWAKQLA